LRKPPTVRTVPVILAALLWCTAIVSVLRLVPSPGAAFAGAASTSSGSPSSFTHDGADVRVEVPADELTGGVDPILVWVRRSMDIVTGYYGRFPASSLRVQVVVHPGDGVLTGKTWGYRGGYIRVEVGREVTAAQLLNDWVLVHEMTHLALPDLDEEHAWLSEGLAVYVEGIAREQAGNRSEQDVFAEQLRAMPRGLPEPGDRGLDRTHTWARTYWGGAMFCFMADVEIHRQTGNRFGLQDAVRAILTDSGGLATDWPIARVLADGDAATGTHVLEELYARWKDTPTSPDLTALWTSLGVERDGESVKLRDDAPLAAVRRSIMQPRANRT